MNKNQAEARAKAVKTLERALTDRNKTIKELRRENEALKKQLEQKERHADL